jgi:hypothetical protein
MRLERGQVWRCLNGACGAQVLVTETGSLNGGNNPRCSCGSVMKMPYSKPQFRRFEDAVEIRKLLEQLAAVLR